jgi:trimeric autotransporter adhesin
MRFRAALIIGALLAAISPGLVFGQGFQGGLRGAVKDSGGVIPGVEVTLTNEATNIARSTTTNERGEYVFTNVDPGTYKLRAVLTGYKTVEQPSIRIGTQQFLTLDVTMEVGRLEENITVTASAPLIETSNASQGTVLDTQALQTLPAPGRNAFMIGTTVPTVVPSGDTQFNRQQDQTNASLISLGGGTRRGNNYTLDGVPITDLRNRMSANPTIEALDDVKVQVHTYDAEMGRTGGGVFNTTLRSGTNRFAGTAFVQTRPIWGQTNNYFSEKARIAALDKGDTNTASKLGKPDSPYTLPGGAFGGPIVKNRTFFWFATEDYTDVQTRNSPEIMPTARERAGDFSQTTNGGRPVIIYDPLTRQPFQGNVIPANRINPIAANMLKYLPAPDVDVDNGTTNYNRTSLIKSKWTQEYTVKLEHKFTDKVSLTGFYLYNRSNEPCQNYFGTADQTEPTRFADPLDYILVRRPKILALNNTNVLSDSSVLSLRFGITRFPDNNTLSLPFDPATLGFSQNYLSQITLKKFPGVRLRGYDTLAGQTLGAINPTEINWKSTSANAAFSKFFGTHTFKVGADFRKIGVDTYIPGNGAGFFDFDKDTTSSTGTSISNNNDGNSLASFLLGYPSGSASRISSISVSTPLNLFTYYYGGYVQDDWRVSPKLTLNYGLRIEHEDGMHELNNNFTVGFDPKVTNALSSVVIPASVDPTGQTAARNVTGGLMYAGIDGNKTTQGNPPKIKWSPRVGAVYSLNSKTVIRGGYGLYWAPYNYPIPSTTASNYGQVGFTQNTNVPQTSPTPTVTLNNPFPNGTVQPSGSSKGTLSGVGTTISYVDQNSTAPRVQQYSIDVQRELPGAMAINVQYLGSRADHLSLGGSNDVAVNINQLDPKYMALGAALSQQVANPFFGNPNAGPLASQATLSRGQLLRPYPQFVDVNARHVLEGKSRYNAAVVEWSKRMTHGIGGRVSYTYSVLKDNQMGEGNFYSAGGTNPMNNYNYIPGSPYYNPDADYAYSLLDVPHRLILAPMFELPFGKGKKYGSNSTVVDLIAGGWQITPAVNIQSGFPLTVAQSDNTGTFSNVQRPNIVPGVSLATSGSYEDRLASADHPTARWLNPDAFSLAPANTFGNAPRTITDVRTARQANVDASFGKNFRLGGNRVALLKIEMLNLFNRVQTRALQGRNTYAVNSTTFGQTAIQAGFMRITQIMVRFSF